jgi:hypothetical protein
VSYDGFDYDPRRYARFAPLAEVELLSMDPGVRAEFAVALHEMREMDFRVGVPGEIVHVLDDGRFAHLQVKDGVEPQWHVLLIHSPMLRDEQIEALLEARHCTEEVLARQQASRAPRSVARRTASLAARLAGSRRAHLRDEWAAILAGEPERGVRLSSWRQSCLALGFLVASVRMRSHDAVGWAWRPVDWSLSKDLRTNGIIAAIVGSQAIYIVDDGGIPALVTEIWEPCGILGAGLYVLARWLRRVRGIELATTSSPPEE